jgi:hypothetical protein
MGVERTWGRYQDELADCPALGAKTPPGRTAFSPRRRRRGYGGTRSFRSQRWDPFDLENEANAAIVKMKNGHSFASRGQGFGRWPATEATMADV